MSNMIQAMNALKKLAEAESYLVFDPLMPNSRPTEVQANIIDACLKLRSKHIIVRAGNQCLPASQLVVTPQGPVSIKDLKIGDTVYSELGLPIKVLKTFQNGQKKVYDLTQRGKVIASATAEHVWQFGVFSRTDGKLLRTDERNTEIIESETAIKRIFVHVPMGTEKPFAPYALAALLGDGCSLEKRLSISKTEGVPQKVAALLGGTAVRQHVNNYTWFLKDCTEPQYYDKWCKNNYAHNKTADLEVIKKWDRESLVQFVAGLIDTDGSCHGSIKEKTVVLSLGMQAQSVVEAFRWAVLALWQVQLSHAVDNRTKYVNGPVHIASCRNSHEIKRILEEVQPHLVSTQKHWKPEYDNYGKRSKKDYVKVTRSADYVLEETYDIYVDSPTNLYLLANGMVTHNSGKSATIAKVFAEMLTERQWKRPERWRGPLQLIMGGRQGRQIESSIWPRIRAHLAPGTYKEIRMGNSLQRVEMTNGNHVIFFSFNNINTAQQAVQSFSAMYCWLDELPQHPKLIEELDKRVLAHGGSVVLTFTPKVPAPLVKKYLEALPKKDSTEFRMGPLDNPAIPQAERDALRERAMASGKSMAAAILYGEWLTGEQGVYNYDPTRCLTPLPANYSNSLWRHVTCVDPGSSSATGIVVLAERPSDGKWLLVLSKYIKGIKDPAELVKKVEAVLANFRITRRIYDTSATWFAGAAAAAGHTYLPIEGKANNNINFITNVNKCLGNNLLIIDSEETEDIQEELATAQWSETNPNKIAHAHEYHTADALKYLLQCLPVWQGPAQEVTGNGSQMRRQGMADTQAALGGANRKEVEISPSVRSRQGLQSRRR